MKRGQDQVSHLATLGVSFFDTIKPSKCVAGLETCGVYRRHVQHVK